MFWSMKMSNARRKPRPTALSVFIADSLLNGGKLKMGPSWTLNTGTSRRWVRAIEKIRSNISNSHICKVKNNDDNMKSLS